MSSSSKEIRAWARAQGLAVGERGRLHPNVIAAYNTAHGEGSTYSTITIGEPGHGTVSEPVEIPFGNIKDFKAYTCGFCQTGTCEHCPGTVRNGSNAPRPFIECSHTHREL